MFNTVEDYKAAIEGVAPSNRYQVKFTRTKFLTAFPKHEYKFLAIAINIPGQELKTSTATFWGMKKEVVSSIDFDPITITFVCDKDLRIRKAFEDWIDEIVNKGTFTVGYYEDYTCDLIITVLNKALQPVREYRVREVHPKNINDISLGYDKNDEAMQFNVSFAFWDFEIKTF